MAEPAIVVDLADVKLLAGKNATIDVLVDGEAVGSIRFGERTTFPCPPGPHQVRAVMRTVVTRKSNSLKVIVPSDGAFNIRATYSRLWGNLKLRSA